MLYRLLNLNTVGLDIGTGTVKVATSTQQFKFPSVIARGHKLDLNQSSEVYAVGDAAVKLEPIRSIVLKTPVYRGAPTSMRDYLALIQHALDRVLKAHTEPIYNAPKSYEDLIIVAGIPYVARHKSKQIKAAVVERFKPKFFGMMYQARATLIHENIQNGIVCHIGHGTTEIMVVIGDDIAYGQTIMNGVGDITDAISTSMVEYLDSTVFQRRDNELAQYRKVLAGTISNALEKVVLNYSNLPVICAGGGALIPKLISEIRNDTISNLQVAKEPVFANALGMLRQAKCV